MKMKKITTTWFGNLKSGEYRFLSVQHIGDSRFLELEQLGNGGREMLVEIDEDDELKIQKAMSVNSVDKIKKGKKFKIPV